MGAWTGEESRARFVRHLPEVMLALASMFLLARSGTVVTPLWALATLLLVTTAVISAAYSRWGRAASPGQVRARILVQSTALTFTAYATGWGSPLAMVHLLAVADNVRYSGARTVRTVLPVALSTVALAQLGVATGIVPSAILPLPSHAIALLSGLILVAVGLRMERASRDKEVAEHEVRRNEERFRTLVQEASDVVVVVADDHITYASPSLDRALGYAEDHVRDLHYLDLIHPDDRESVVSAVLEMLTTPGTSGLIECRLRHRDGHWVAFESSCRNLIDDPSVGGFVITGRDVTERKCLEAELEHRAFHDTLTGLVNRGRFLERLEQAVARAERKSAPVALLYLDLDGFKEVNDDLGHAAGDHVLREVAGRILALSRTEDTVARLGGDEFAVLLDDPRDAPAASLIADRMIDAIRRPVSVEGGTVRVGASVGIATWEPGKLAAELLRAADDAMYRAKAEGKGRYELADPVGRPPRRG